MGGHALKLGQLDQDGAALILCDSTDVISIGIGQFLVELLMFAFLVGALHGVGLCPVKSST